MALADLSGRLSPGMTPNEVDALLGLPEEVDDTIVPAGSGWGQQDALRYKISPGEPVLQWTYCDDEHDHVAWFARRADTWRLTLRLSLPRGLASDRLPSSKRGGGGVANPYESPTTSGVPVETPISDAIVRRLIDGIGIEVLAFYDVSDCQIYGRKYRRLLSGVLASDAESAGCAPTVYQAIHWICLAFIPVWPLGTFVVMPFAEYDDLEDEAVRYRAIRTAWDSGQVAIHYAAMLVPMLTAGVLVWQWWP